jgi:hypothetical protein
MINRNLEWSGRSVFRPSDACRERGSFNLNMLAEDAGLEIWSHWTGRAGQDEGQGGGLAVEFKPRDDRVAALTASCVQRGYRNDLKSSLAEFAQMIAREIIINGTFTYELQLGRDPQSKKVCEATLSPVFVPNGRVFVAGKMALQMVPRSLAPRIGSRRVVRLDGRDVLVFRVPREWRPCLRRVRYASKTYDKLEQRFRDDVLKALEEQKDRLAMAENREAHLTMLARSIALTGWYGRGVFSEHITDYQLVEWQIRWKLFCRDVGESILKQIARATARIAKEIGSESRLTWELTPDSEEIGNLRDRLQRGDTSFTDALKLLARG